MPLNDNNIQTETPENQQREGGLCGGKYKMSSRNNQIAPQNINFVQYKLDTMQWPYLVTFSLEVDMIEGDHIFCENLEKQSHEVFDDCQEKGEITYLSGFWFMGQVEYMPENQQNVNNNNGKKNGGQNQEQFITDNDEQLIQKQQQLENQQKFAAISEKEEDDYLPSLEITQEYYQKNYKKIMKYYESEKHVLHLYFDSLKEKLVIVKELKNQYDHIDTIKAQIDNERKRVARAVRDAHLPEYERFNENYDDEIKGLNRNTVRELMISFLCNQLYNQSINKLEGVILGENYFKIVYEYFGGTEINSPNVNCDLESYFTKNIITYFQHKNYNQTRDIVQEILYNIMNVVSSLHTQGIFMRDLQPKHILVRRRFNPVQPTQSIYEIQLIHMGKSKRIPIEGDLGASTFAQNNPNNRLNQQSLKILSKPQQLFGRDNNENKNSLDFKRDDTFQLGILLYKIYQILGLQDQIDEQTKQNLQQMTGLPFDTMTEYQDIMQKVKKLFKGGLEEALKYEENIQDLEILKNNWNNQPQSRQKSEQSNKN